MMSLAIWTETTNRNLMVFNHKPLGHHGRQIARATGKIEHFPAIPAIEMMMVRLISQLVADGLARDLHRLGTSGYRAESAQIFDMFPRTSCFESLTLLRR